MSAMESTLAPAFRQWDSDDNRRSAIRDNWNSPGDNNVRSPTRANVNSLKIAFAAKAILGAIAGVATAALLYDAVSTVVVTGVALASGASFPASALLFTAIGVISSLYLAKICGQTAISWVPQGIRDYRYANTEVSPYVSSEVF